MKELFQSAFELIKSAERIAIAGHLQPDGDCIGSALALKSALTNMGKYADVFFDAGHTGVAKQFSFLEHYEQIRTKLPLSVQKEYYDLLIIVDLNALDRLGEFEYLRPMCKQTVVFDHHNGFSLDNVDVKITDPARPACGELIFEFFKTNDVKITPEIANALYTAIAMDTGGFMYPSTRSATHLIIAQLIALGCDIELINYKIFLEFDAKLLEGLQDTIKNLKFFADGKIAVTLLRKKFYTNFDKEERNKFKKYVADLSGVKVSATFGEDFDGVYRIGLRSHDGYDVEVVAKHFGGGGHTYASGCTVRGKYKSVMKSVVKELEKLFEMPEIPTAPSTSDDMPAIYKG